MKKILLLSLFFLFLNLIGVGQSKKQIIKNLNSRIDSIETIISIQNNSVKQLTNYLMKISSSTTTYEKAISSNSDALQKLKSKVAEQDKKIKQLESQIQSFNYFIDGLNNDRFNAFSHTKTNWDEITDGNKIRGFSLIGEEIKFDNKNFKGDIAKLSDNYNTHVYKAAISPLSKKKRYVAIYLWEAGLFFCDLTTMYSYRLDIYAPYIWLSWSPNMDYVIFHHYYEEADATMYSYDIKSNTLKELDLRRDVKKDNEGFLLEDIRFDVENLIWISPFVFKIVANFHCNPYTYENCNYDNEWKEILHSYTYTYDIKQNKIINTKKH
jgi:uncharacterized coiled-coil protein SlyX